MINMAMTKAEAKTYSGDICCPGDDKENGPKYPWGLEIRLDNGAVLKLGLTALPEVGSTMLLQAQVVVTSVSSNQRQGNEVQNNVELQITDMELSLPGKTDAERASALYK